jgi:tRNA(adenine34) deaminase
MADTFEAKVQDQLERLQSQGVRAVEADIAARRMAWLRQHVLPVKEPGAITPRRAFELLFFEHMRLSPHDLPVVSETEHEIVWRSVNRCPTLEVCARLGLDTRQVCRAANEKATQVFLSQLDPQLRFLRSYTEIRPHADYCLERIVRIDFDALMRMAIAEAKISLAEGNKGYGAVVALGDEVAGRAHDTAATEHDPSLHAEVNAIRQAARRLGDANLSGAVLVSSCEPCPMCSSLAVWANLTTIVYGISIAETAKMGKARILVSSKEIVERSPVMVEVIGEVLRNECRELYI